ncbi:MAG: S-adenosylmethionine:tRNA ribosyltransferase-isomerase [Bacteroidales bacterium]|nr:S-adenosylmethionine:tRNA ribosyltransferase-isomerase [Bacteroidales bacterium]
MVENKIPGSNLFIDNYDYDLPAERIAKYPLKDRDGSKILIYKEKLTFHDVFDNLPRYLHENTLLVFNNTKVIQARVLFYKETGARIEVFCLEPLSPPEYNLSFQSKDKVVWKCIVGNLKKWKGSILHKELKIEGQLICFSARLINDYREYQEIEFFWDNTNYCFGEIINLFGVTPIPPYLNRNSEEIDIERYQTVYSKIKGSVAAPTAGLHFTNEVFKQLKKKNIKIEEITLHVGAGTFKPVKSDTVNHHQMHTEYFSVTKLALNNLLNHNGPVIPVGTTSLRALESLYWLGVKVSANKPDFFLDQWECYLMNGMLDLKKSLGCLIEYMDIKNLNELQAKTQLMIIPGYKFRFWEGLITNFHQPRSTLLLLVAAFIGNDWKNIYNYALNNDFRFLSYGDSCLLLKGEE